MQITSPSQLNKVPSSREAIITNADLVNILNALVGKPFNLSGKPRTDGAKLRNMISSLFIGRDIAIADKDQYTILPPKKKGVPRMLLILLDSYIVTTGNSYNLQVWNRIPTSDNVLIQYENGQIITCKDIRYALVKVNTTTQVIDSVILMTAEKIKAQFGEFGVPTIKHQLIIPEGKRKEIIQGALLIPCRDTIKMQYLCKTEYLAPNRALRDFDMSNLWSIHILKERLQALIGKRLIAADTKTRGQLLERMVANLLGYSEEDNLVGGYPDLPNQLLEIKLQESPTIDLGAHSPQIKETICRESNITTQDIRYLIALTNPKDSTIEGIILTSGGELGNHFSYVPSKNYKCQRSIPMDFFEQNKGFSIYNPTYPTED